jgi:hypothetical protein
MNSEKEDRESLYYSRIESCFIGLRGSPLLLCGKDFMLMKQWYRAGMPLNTVLKGIREAFEKFDGKQPSGKKINSLRYCEQAVARAWEESREARIGRHVSGEDPAAYGPDGQNVPDHLEKLLAACRGGASGLAGDQKPEAPFSQALDRLEGLLRESRSDKAPGLEAIEDRLMDIEKEMAAVLKAAHPPETVEKLRKAFRKQIIERAGSISEDILAGMVENLVNERLLSEAGLPRLSLFL